MSFSRFVSLFLTLLFLLTSSVIALFVWQNEQAAKLTQKLHYYPFVVINNVRDIRGDSRALWEMLLKAAYQEKLEINATAQIQNLENRLDEQYQTVAARYLGSKKEIEILKSSIDAFLQTTHEGFETYAAQGAQATRLLLEEKNAESLYYKLREATTKIIDYSNAKAQEYQNASEFLFLENKKYSLIAYIALLGLSLLVGFMMVRYIKKEIEGMLSAIKSIKNFDLKSTANGKSFIREFNEIKETVKGIAYDIHTSKELLDENIEELHDANSLLKKERERYHKLLETATDGIHIIDEDGRLVEFSDSFAAMLGYTPQELINIKVFDWDVSTKAELDSLVGTLFTKPHTFEAKHKRKDGTIIDVQINSQPIYLEGKKYLYASSRDITALKSYQEQLTLANEQFKNMFYDHSSIMLLIDPRSAQIIDVNKSAEEFYGYTREEFLALSIYDINTLSKEEITKLKESAFNKEVNRFHFEHKLKNGKTAFMDVDSAPITTSQGVFLFSVLKDVTKQKVLEENLRAQKNFTSTIIDNANAVIAVIDDEGRMFKVNRYAREFLGYTEEEIAKKPYFWKRFLPVAMQEKVLGIIENARNGRIFKSFQNSWIAKNGEERIFKWSNMLVQKSDGSMDYLATIGIDVTQEELLKNEMEENRKKWIFSVEANGDGYWEWNIQTSEVHFSAVWKKMLGFEEDEISSSLSEWEKRIHPDDKERVMADVREHLEGKTKQYKNEHRVLCKDGSYKWILDRGVIFTYDSERKPLIMIGTHSDISQSMALREKLEEFNLRLEKKVEEELKERMRTVKLFKEVIDSLDLQIILLDKSYKCIIANNGFKNLYSLNDTDMIGKTLSEMGVLDAERFEAFLRPRLDTALKGEIVHYKTNISIQNQELIADVLMTPFNPQKSIEGVIVIAKDITKEHNLELENFQNQKKAAMGDLIGIIAHQLKQPLNVLMLHSDVLVDEFEENRLTQEAVEGFKTEVDEQIMFMAKSIDELRNFFRPDKKVEPFSIRTGIQKALAIIEKGVSGKGINVMTDFEEDANVLGILSELQQVIINVVTNAKEALLETKTINPFIKISTRKQNANAIIDIEDNGGGIAKEVIDKVFDSYFTTKGEKGTGIGLNLAKMIIEGMHGKISVKNTDKGALFTIELPQAA